MAENVTQQLIKTRNDIKDKLNALKTARYDSSESLKRSYEPLAALLTKTSMKNDKFDYIPRIKKEEEEEAEDGFDPVEEAGDEGAEETGENADVGENSEEVGDEAADVSRENVEGRASAKEEVRQRQFEDDDDDLTFNATSAAHSSIIRDFEDEDRFKNQRFLVPHIKFHETTYTSNPAESYFYDEIMKQSLRDNGIPFEDDDDKDDSVQTITDEQVNSQIMNQADSENLREFFGWFHELPRFYIVNAAEDTNHKEYEGNFLKIKLDENKITYGDSELLFASDNPNITIKKDGQVHVFEGTPGLYELLFKIEPDQQDVRDEDRQALNSIIMLTNAHRAGFKVTNRPIGNRGKKYKNIIKPILQAYSNNPSGSGMQMEYNNNPIQYTHWDDPNELIDRLRLLVASSMAGNNAHHNEIVSIIEELREADIIE